MLDVPLVVKFDTDGTWISRIYMGAFIFPTAPEGAAERLSKDLANLGA